MQEERKLLFNYLNSLLLPVAWPVATKQPTVQDKV